MLAVNDGGMSAWTLSRNQWFIPASQLSSFSCWLRVSWYCLTQIQTAALIIVWLIGLIPWPQASGSAAMLFYQTQFDNAVCPCELTR